MHPKIKQLLQTMIFLLAVQNFTPPAFADENSSASMGTATKNQHLMASLIAEPAAIVPGKNFTVGLKLKMEPHWHVYWINPGDAGLPVSIAWDLPKGFSADPIQWPYPERIAVPPLMNYGYENAVLLPIQLHAPENLGAGSKITLKAKAKWIVCNEICLPGSAELALEMPVQTGKNTDAKKNPATENEFKDAISHLPITTSPWKISAQILDSTLTIVVTGKTGMTEANTEQAAGTLPNPGSFIFFPLTTDVIDNAAPQKLYTIKNGYALDIKLVAKIEDTLSGVLVSTHGWRTKIGEKALLVHLVIKPAQAGLARLAPVTTELTPGEKSSPKPEPTLSPSTLNKGVMPDGSLAMTPQSGAVKLLGMMFFAFVGGLILNLMPCVLPVLSLKIFDFVKRAGESRWKIFSHGLSFTAGVLISFWLLAGLLLILRSGGQQLGWGFQLQSPAFLIVLCALFFFFSLNLFGVFELGYMFTRIGGTGTQSGHAGSFFAGMTATVVATPCTAPFMGSAMGYAFTQPPYYAMLVFTFLGLGMAAPYLLLSGFPALMKFLPKPGAWMEHLKQFMGFPLLATAIWLAWVLGHQAGVDALIALLFILLLGGVSAWILGKWTALHHEISTRVVAGIIALVVFLPAFVLVLVYLDQIRDKVPKPFASMGGAASSSDIKSNEIKTEPFSEAALADYLSAGKPVFVDFTADWCLSCKVNERIAFGSQDVIKKFSQLQLTVLKADWTSRDEAITQALAKFGRSSIPFYVLYTGKGKDNFVVLPEVLSAGIVLQSLEQVKLPPTTL